MVASIDTVSKIIDVVRSHVDDLAFDAILTELETIRGNQSFIDTIRRIRQQSRLTKQ